MRQKFIPLIVSLIFLILIGAGIFLYKHEFDTHKNNYYGVIYNKETPDFTLISHNGARVTLSQFKDKVTLVFFGYTNCPDICPTTLSVLKNVMEELGSRKNQVQVLFVTVDPERDAVEKLKAYVPYYSKDFLGLTASPQEIEKVANAFRVFYMKEDRDSQAGYLMSHTSSLYLINQRENLLLVYTSEKMNPKWIAKDIRKILG